MNIGKTTLMIKKFEFDIELIKHEEIDGAYFIVPFDAVKEFGKRGLIKVRATFDGAEYRGSLMPMGDGKHCIGLTKAIRSRIKKGPGDVIHVTIEEDKAERTVEIPAELEAILKKHKKARAFFDSLSYTHRKEYARWIASAKREETKIKRIKKAEEYLLSGVKTPDAA